MDPNHEEEVLILVKAVPRPSRRYGETVCCAGVTRDQKWRRLYPIRFRQLSENRFRRWQWVRYRWRPPTSDKRAESRYVFEDKLTPGRMMPERERASFLAPLIVGSAKEAAARGQSLALVRPLDARFRWKAKSQEQIDQERQEYAAVAQQPGLFDRELATLEPSPYEFRFSFRDQDGRHHHFCGDWETAATFWRQSPKYGIDSALQHLDKMYNHIYPEKGMVVALGTMFKRPKTWLLLGIVRLDAPPAQGSLFGE